MTSYAVDWPEEVLSDLTDIWLRAPDRQAVTDAQARIDRLLGANPFGNGIHVSEGLYSLHAPPLAVSYTIDPSARRVEIQSVSERA
jgi:hypothetical protein